MQKAQGLQLDETGISMRSMVIYHGIVIQRIIVDLIFLSGHTELLAPSTNHKHFKIIVNSSNDVESSNTFNTSMSSLDTLDIKRLLRGDPGNTSSFIKAYIYILKFHSNFRTFHVGSAAINQLLVFPDQGQERRTF
ncbi:hypothetical protein BGX21_006191, partial [Mortierella sp. AD011]